MNAPIGKLAADPLSILKPDCTDPEERDLRERLLVARNIAHADLHRLAGPARDLMLALLETAGAWVFAPASVDDLRNALNFCRQLMRCVVLAEKLEDGAND
jgi:hypothetical protein